MSTSDKELQGLKNFAEQLEKDAAERHRRILDTPMLTTPDVQGRFDRLAQIWFGTLPYTFAEPPERPFWHDDCLPQEAPHG